MVNVREKLWFGWIELEKWKNIEFLGGNEKFRCKFCRLDSFLFRYRWSIIIWFLHVLFTVQCAFLIWRLNFTILLIFLDLSFILSFLLLLSIVHASNLLSIFQPLLQLIRHQLPTINTSRPLINTNEPLFHLQRNITTSTTKTRVMPRFT